MVHSKNKKGFSGTSENDISELLQSNSLIPSILFILFPIPLTKQ